MWKPKALRAMSRILVLTDSTRAFVGPCVRVTPMGLQ
jgi:hypothetical protein